MSYRVSERKDGDAERIECAKRDGNLVHANVGLTARNKFVNRPILGSLGTTRSHDVQHPSVTYSQQMAILPNNFDYGCYTLRSSERWKSLPHSKHCL